MGSSEQAGAFLPYRPTAPWHATSGPAAPNLGEVLSIFNLTIGAVHDAKGGDDDELRSFHR